MARAEMTKARQAAEERWPSYPAVGFSGAADRQVAFLAGVAWALPENPDPAVIEAIKRAIYGQIAFRGGDEEHYESVRGGIYDDAALAAYAAMRGAMQ